MEQEPRDQLIDLEIRLGKVEQALWRIKEATKGAHYQARLPDFYHERKFALQQIRSALLAEIDTSIQTCAKQYSWNMDGVIPPEQSESAFGNSL